MDKSEGEEGAAGNEAAVAIQPPSYIVKSSMGDNCTRSRRHLTTPQVSIVIMPKEIRAIFHPKKRKGVLQNLYKSYRALSNPTVQL